MPILIEITGVAMPRITPFFLLWFFILIGCSTDSSRPYECGDPLGCLIIAPGDPVRIVSMQALTGDLAKLGQEYARIMELAASDMNNQILGHPVLVTFEDEGCSREGGQVASKKVISDFRIVGVHGTTCSISSVPAADIISQADMVIISGCSTAPSLTGVGGLKGENWQPGFFRTAPNDTYQAVAAAYFAYNQLMLRKAAVVSDGDPYTVGLASSFEEAFAALGGEVVFSSQVNRGDRNMRPLLEAISTSRAEILFFPLFPVEGEHIVAQKKEFDALRGMKLMSADGLLNSLFVDRMREYAKGMYFVGPALPENEKYQSFVNRYEEVFGLRPDGTYHAHTYDAAMLLLKAIENSSLKLDDGSLVIRRQALRDSLRSTHGFQGLTGLLSCDELGDCGVPRFKLFYLEDPAAGYEGLLRNIVSTFELNGSSISTHP